MKIVKTVDITFVSGKYQGTASVNVPFGVKFAHFRCASYNAGTPAVQFVYIRSDMTEMQPIALVSTDNATTGTDQNILIEYSVPKVIQGTYNFYMNEVASGFPPYVSTGDYCTVICEFYDEGAYPPNVLTKRPFGDFEKHL